MRVAIISDWFSEKMGYAENCLPKALASAGADVHLISSDAQVYYGSSRYTEVYEPFLGSGLVPCCEKPWDGFTLHRLPHAWWRRRLRIRGLTRLLRKLRPNVVQTLDPLSPTTYQSAILSPLLRFRLFLESHVHASIFPPTLGKIRSFEQQRWKVYRNTVGRWLSIASRACYAISPDCADICRDWFGVEPTKIRVDPLGVDTELFRPSPATDDQRSTLRRSLGFADDEIVCVYTGRFSPDKGPLILADAIHLLNSAGKRFRGLFVGGGTPADADDLRRRRGCSTVDFVPARDLPPYYRCADIGVWPKQESTSQLDAAACGLPLVLSDRIHVLERVDGNGLTYREGDSDDLARRLLELSDPDVRHRLGVAGSAKMRADYGWDRIARNRLRDYASL